jgi:four helix bundle protein
MHRRPNWHSYSGQGPEIGVAAEEASEVLEWLLSLKDAGIGDLAECEALIQEASELTAILTSSHKTATGR